MTRALVTLLRKIHPETRVRIAARLFVASIIGWLATHALMLATMPEGFTSWTAHVLLAISWVAISVTMLDVILTADVRNEAAG